MPVLKTYRNGAWENVSGFERNADTVDGKHASEFASAEHTHTYESVVGLEDVINEISDSKFYVVTFDMGDDGEYHGDLTFAEIREKFEAGGNMVARIDGTDYIPLLSAAEHQIIFSGIYQTTSVSLTIDKNDVCTLSSTSLARSNHSHPTASSSTSGFMSKEDKVKLNNLDSTIEAAVASKQDTLTGTEGQIIQFDASGKPVAVNFDAIKSIVVNGESAPIVDGTVSITIPEVEQVQSDWNQNDETAADYIKNKPFYDNTEVLVDNITVNNGDTLDFVVRSFGNTGDVVSVIWDGVLTNKTIGYCVVKSGSLGFPYDTIGNQSYIADTFNDGGDDTGEDYVICSKDGDYVTTSTIICDDNSHTLSIVKGALVQIDDKFLPYIWKGSDDGALIFNNGTNVASGARSHAEGNNTTASGVNAHAEGSYTTASNYNAHAEGVSTTASGHTSHAEGGYTIASGARSHAEGKNTTASGVDSHAEGGYTTASAYYSHAEGYHTIASNGTQHVQGRYNIKDTSNTYAHIVGNGKSEDKRSNAHTLDWNGNAEYAGDVIAKGCGGDSPISLVEIAEKTKQLENLENIDLGNVVYYEEVTDENEEDVMSALCFDQLSLSFDGTNVYLKFGNTILSSVDITAEFIACTGISLDTTEIDVMDSCIGDTYTLVPSVLPDNCSQEVEWNTSNASVATVSNGVVTLIGCGNATITATYGDHTATCNVIVESTVVDVEIINGIYSEGTNVVKYMNSSTCAVTNPFAIKLDSNIDYTVSMNNTDYNILIVGLNMTDDEADYYISNVGEVKEFAGKISHWGGWINADGTVHEINKTSCPYLQVLIQKVNNTQITSADLQTIKNALVIRKVVK